MRQYYNEILTRVNEKPAPGYINNTIKKIIETDIIVVLFDISIILELHDKQITNKIFYICNDEVKYKIAKSLNNDNYNIIFSNDIFHTDVYNEIDNITVCLSTLTGIKNNNYKYTFISKCKYVYDKTKSDVYIGKSLMVYEGFRQFKKSKNDRPPAQYELYDNIFIFMNYSNLRFVVYINEINKIINTIE